MSYQPPGKFRTHGAIAHPLAKTWQHETGPLQPSDLIYPIFVTDKDEKAKDEIKALPGQYRWGVEMLEELLAPLVKKGLKSVIIFGVVSDDKKKDLNGSYASSSESPVIRAIKKIRSLFPTLYVIVDVCLCAYTLHGHCGILRGLEKAEDRVLDNQASIDRLAEVALAYAEAGAHCVAPSDMMDGRIGAIKHYLRYGRPEQKSSSVKDYTETVSVMSYSAKFASVFYGPFRDACGSGMSFGDRSGYQLPPPSKGVALKCIERDLEEGADSIMIKPGLPYLDIIAEAKKMTNVPVCAYHVSGEYAMLYHAAQAGAFKLEESVYEVMMCFKRGGCTMVLTYFTPLLLDVIIKKTQQDIPCLNQSS